LSRLPLMTPGRDEREMPAPYSEKFKARMIKRMTGPGAMTATALAREVGVAQSTLSAWLRRAKVGGMSKDDRGTQRKRRTRRSPEEKLRLVMESMGLRGEELGAFLRREGLHEEELEQLQDEVRRSALEGLRPKKKRRGKSPEQRRIAKLEKDLARKEKALAETAALLVLQGKVQAFLSAEEEGDTGGSSEK